jgi:membrane-bound lytic murein transglycosylase MltF
MRAPRRDAEMLQRFALRAYRVAAERLKAAERWLDRVRRLPEADEQTVGRVEYAIDRGTEAQRHVDAAREVLGERVPREGAP